MKLQSALMLLCSSGSMLFQVNAMPANPEPVEMVDEDGSTFMARLVGGEDDNYIETMDGYTVVGTGDKGAHYELAEYDEELEDVVPTGIKASGSLRPQWLQKGLRRGRKGLAANGLGGAGPMWKKAGYARKKGGGAGGRGGRTGRTAGGGLDGRMLRTDDVDDEFTNAHRELEEVVATRFDEHGRRLKPGIDYSYKLPEEAHDHIDDYEHWDERVEDFHRRRQLQSGFWTGNKKNLVVMLRFSDHTSRPGPTVAQVTELMNSDGKPAEAPTGSVKRVFQHSSYGALTMESTVMEWVTVPNTEAYYTNGNSGLSTKTHELIRDGLNVLETRGIDFTQFDLNNDGLIDAICFLHSGYAAENGGTDQYNTGSSGRMWSHKWSLYTLGGGQGWVSASTGVRVYNYHISPAVWGRTGSAIGRIGVIAHETGHFLGLPDLYDTGGSDGVGGSGIGSWGLMANSWGFDGTQRCPPIMSPWSKLQLGWINPTVVSTTGSYSLDFSYANSDFIRIDKGYPNREFLLLEYRKKTPNDFEYCMPTDGGLAVWHIDDAGDFNNQGYPGDTLGNYPFSGKHYRVSLSQADRDFYLEKQINRGDGGDLYNSGQSIGPGNGSTVFPNTDSYQGGNIVETGIVINNIGATTGNTLTFNIQFPATGPTTPPTPAPTKAPTAAPTKAPTRPCVDMFAPVEWYDRDGPTYDCAWYAVGTRCASYGNNYNNCDSTVGDGNDDRVWEVNGSCPNANIVCCACGGGVDPRIEEDTDAPTESPVASPTASPVDSPTASPVASPTASPVDSPTASPVDSPTASPVDSPTASPVDSPTSSPVESPTASPVESPTANPTDSPTDSPTNSPTGSPTTGSPTDSPTDSPTESPTHSPTDSPTEPPTDFPTDSPTEPPTDFPTDSPTESPTDSPTDSPTEPPTRSPTKAPTSVPTKSPTESPTKAPTDPVTCVDGSMKLVLDSYPSETNWFVKEMPSGAVKGTHNGSSGTTNLSCMDPSTYYHFAITDSYGDGNCCAWGQGSYAVAVDGSVVKSGGAFEGSEEVMFKPTPSSTDVEWKMIYKSDSWPDEMKWTLTSDSDGVLGTQAFKTYRARNKLYKIEAIVDPTACYTLSVNDSYGDGVISGGYIQVYWNGALKYDFGSARANGNYGSGFTVTLPPNCSPAGSSPVSIEESPAFAGLSFANGKKKDKGKKMKKIGDEKYEEETEDADEDEDEDEDEESKSKKGKGKGKKGKGKGKNKRGFQ